MASGNTLCVFTPKANEPPATNYATLDTRNSHPVLEFDAATIESAIFSDLLPKNYAAGGLTVTVVWMADTATASDVVWGASFERHQDETTDFGTDDFAAERTVTSTAPAAVGRPQYANVTFTDGAQMDSLTVGESFRIKIRRVASDAADTMAGDAQLICVTIQET